MKLIINGDDFALTKGATQGIIYCIKNGIMTDTTVMVNMPYFEESMELAAENDINEMGIHFTLTCGKPVLDPKDIPSLVDENGNFYRKPQILKEKFKLEDAEKELRAQLQKFLNNNSNIRLNHMDGHHHFYAFHEDLFKLVMKLAKENNMPMRNADVGFGYKVSKEIKHPTLFSGEFFGEEKDLMVKDLEILISKYKDVEVLEFMAHPAFIDDELKEISSYSNQREVEKNILTSNEIKRFIEDNGIELISYSEL